MALKKGQKQVWTLKQDKLLVRAGACSIKLKQIVEKEKIKEKFK